MSEQRALFSESWHRVANQRLRLRPSVILRRQRFRGERWFVAQDGFTNSFFRFRPEAYEFIARLDGTRTVEEIWHGCLERTPETAPGQGEIVAMLAQLYQANLLAADTPADTQRLFERHQKRSRQQVMSQLFGIFFLRIRLFDPEPWLRRTWPMLRWLATPAMGIAFAVLAVFGLVAVFSNWERALDQSQAVMAPENLLLLYGAFTLAKLIHEFGHAYAVKAFGGEVHAMGVTLLVFTPIPYVDATAAWAFRERWKRVMVGLSGMLPELVYASIAALVWAGTGPGTLNSLAYNTMVVASVSTLLFNLNPLLRFDGYYILSDLTDSPNLQPRAARQWLHWFEHKVLGVRSLESPARTKREATWLMVFGAASFTYRTFITVVIILLVADRFFGLGLLAGVLTFIGAFVLPLVKAAKYLASEPRIERSRKRAWWVTGGAVAAILVFLAAVPMPNRFRAPGVVRAEGSRDVYTGVSGFAVAVHARSGSKVELGQPLARLENPEIDFAIAAAQADVEEARGRERHMLSELAAGIAPTRARREVAERRLAEVEKDRENLEVRAPAAGTWVAPVSDDWAGMWLSRGMRIGEIVGEGPGWEFQAVVSQDHASELFNAVAQGAEVRFRGAAGVVVPISEWRVVPGRQEFLPSPALGWSAGGPIKVKPEDRTGMHAEEPFFLVIGRIAPGAADAKVKSVLWQGRTGVLRMERPWTPLLVQWARQFRQLIQERYRI